MKSNRDRSEVVTATGMRLVGKAATLVSPAAAAGIDAPRREEDVLFAAHFHLLPRRGNDAIAAALPVIDVAIAESRKEIAPLARTNAISEFGGRFHAVQWDTFTDGDRWVGELIWRHAHPAVPGVPCTTHIVLSAQSGHASMTVRVGTQGGFGAVRGVVGAGQARPAFLPELNRAVRLVFDGRSGEPRTLGENDMRAFVANTLLDEDRMIPVAVQAPTEDGDYLVPPATLAEELLGVAHLYVIDRHPTTFRLTDELGDRRLSAYWGAMHVYLPGFSCADSPERHPLLLDDRLVDPVMRAQLVGPLSLHMRPRISIPSGVAELRDAAASALRSSTVEATPVSAIAEEVVVSLDAVEQATVPEPTANEIATPSAGAEIPRRTPADAPTVQLLPPIARSDFLSEDLVALLQPLADLPAALAQLAQSNAALVDEIARLRTTNAVRAANAVSLERQVGELERLLRRHIASAGSQQFADADEAAVGEDDRDAAAGVEHEAQEGVALAVVVRHAATSHADALLILDDAVRSAEESPYLDSNRVAIILDAMASLARRRQAGTLGMSLRDAFRELGVDYRGFISRSTSSRHRQQYVGTLLNGTKVECYEHLVLGTSYDPRHCLRIYFTSQVAGEPRFVISHVGRHFDVASTT